MNRDKPRVFKIPDNLYLIFETQANNYSWSDSRGIFGTKQNTMIFFKYLLNKLKYNKDIVDDEYINLEKFRLYPPGSICINYNFDSKLTWDDSKYMTWSFSSINDIKDVLKTNYSRTNNHNITEWEIIGQYLEKHMIKNKDLYTNLNILNVLTFIKNFNTIKNLLGNKYKQFDTIMYKVENDIYFEHLDKDKKVPIINELHEYHDKGEDSILGYLKKYLPNNTELYLSDKINPSTFNKNKNKIKLILEKKENFYDLMTIFQNDSFFNNKFTRQRHMLSLYDIIYDRKDTSKPMVLFCGFCRVFSSKNNPICNITNSLLPVPSFLDKPDEDEGTKLVLRQRTIGLTSSIDNISLKPLQDIYFLYKDEIIKMCLEDVSLMRTYYLLVFRSGLIPFNNYCNFLKKIEEKLKFLGTKKLHNMMYMLYNLDNSSCQYNIPDDLKEQMEKSEEIKKYMKYLDRVGYNIGYEFR